MIPSLTIRIFGTILVIVILGFVVCIIYSYNKFKKACAHMKENAIYEQETGYKSLHHEMAVLLINKSNQYATLAKLLLMLAIILMMIIIIIGSFNL